MTETSRSENSSQNQPHTDVVEAVPYPEAEPLIGRQTELELLLDSLESARRGGGELAIIRASSGCGKSRLLQEITSAAQAKGFLCLAGNERAQAGDNPLPGLCEIVDQLISYLEQDDSFLDNFRSQSKSDIPLVLALFPNLARALHLAPPTNVGPEHLFQQRAVQSLVRILCRLGSEQNPVIICLDDCQWSDAVTQSMIAQWQQYQKKSSYTVLAVAYRSDELPNGSQLNSIQSKATVDLQPFSQDQIEQFVSSYLGQAAAAVPKVLMHMTGGNPFLVSCTIRGFIEAKVLELRNGSWQLVTDEEKHEDDTDDLDPIKLRFDLLPPKVRQVLKIASVIGKRFSSQAIATILERSSSETMTMLVEAERKHMLHRGNEGDSFEFVHDKLRETLLEMLPETERLAIHLHIARYLQQFHIDPYAIAFHLIQAKLQHEAVPYALTAANESRKRYALDAAREYYQFCLEHIAEVSASQQFEVHYGFGVVLSLIGQYQLAHPQLQEALKLCDDVLELADIRGQLGEIHFKQGNVTEACEQYAIGLEILGIKCPNSSLQAFGSMLIGFFRQLLHTILYSLIVGSKKRSLNRRETLTFSLLNRIGVSYWFLKDISWLFWAHFQALNTLELYKPSPNLAYAYSLHGIGCALFMHYPRGQWYVDRGIAMREELNDYWGLGQSLNFSGVYYYISCRYAECIEATSEAVKILEETGDTWEASNARVNQAYSLYRLGRKKDALELIQQNISLCEERDDYNPLAASIIVLAKVTEGDFHYPNLDSLRERLKDSDKQSFTCLTTAKAIQALRIGEYQEPIQILEDNFSFIFREGTFHEYTIILFPWLLTAYRAKFQQEGINRESLLRLTRLIPLALCYSFKSQNYLPHVLREIALIAEILGCHRVTRVLLKLALARSRKFRMESATLATERVIQQIGA